MAIGDAHFRQVKIDRYWIVYEHLAVDRNRAIVIYTGGIGIRRLHTLVEVAFESRPALRKNSLARIRP